MNITYTYNNNKTVNTNTLGLTRGYCAHEHWNQFGLIDMNGRFYDPVVARFLSPDPPDSYRDVQSPTNLQNFNRYSYCLNNPLKYNDPSGEWILTWGINKGGFSIGLNFAPYPVGFGINIGWSDGFSLGAYGELGERFGGDGLGSGIYAQQGFSYNFKHNEWSTNGSEGAYASFACFSASTSYDQNYNFYTKAYHDSWSVGAGLGWGNDNYGHSFGVGYTSGSNGGWEVSYGGNLYYDPSAAPKYTNEITYSAPELKQGIPEQPDHSAYCYGYALAYADAGHGNRDAQYFIDAAEGAYGADMSQVARKAGMNDVVSRIPNSAASYEALGKRIRAGKEGFGAIAGDQNHWTNITSVTMADKRRIVGYGYKRVVKSTTIWNPIGGHMRGPTSFLKIGSIF